eukprot:2657867-Amphidinium_carterae.1
MRELRQPASTFQSAAAASASPYNFDAMWQRLLPGRFASLIPMFRNDRRQRDIREIEDLIPKVRAFLEAWENVPQNLQPKWYHDALAGYSIENRMQWIFFEHGNPKEWMSPLPEASMQ